MAIETGSRREEVPPALAPENASNRTIAGFSPRWGGDDSGLIEREGPARRLRAKTLRDLRWGSAFLQLLAVIVSQFVLGFELPIIACIVCILALVWFNVISAMALPPNARLPERSAQRWLIFDTMQVGMHLALTGGLSNPFTLLIVAPTSIAAASIGAQRTAIIALIAGVSIMLLGFWYLPLFHPEVGVYELPGSYRFAVAAALLTFVAILGVHVRRASSEATSMSRALSAAQMALSREKQVSSLGALAAAAAHQLGTPLATIAVTARELRDDHPDAREDLALISEQVQRCRTILGELATLGPDPEPLGQAPILAIVQEAAGPHLGEAVRIEYFVDGVPVEEGGVPTMMVARKPETIHSLRNLIQNAVDFAESVVWIEIVQRPNRLILRVQDDGPGFGPQILARLGDPFVTTRGSANRKGDAYQGMGLGLFIAKTLLERSGATLALSNQRESATSLPGAVAEISWPLDDERALTPT